MERPPRTIERAIELAKAAGVDAISFWPTHNPFYGFSYRYALGRLDHIGFKNWKGREVDLRKDRDPKSEGREESELRMAKPEASPKGV